MQYPLPEGTRVYHKERYKYGIILCIDLNETENQGYRVKVEGTISPRCWFHQYLQPANFNNNEEALVLLKRRD